MKIIAMDTRLAGRLAVGSDIFGIRVSETTALGEFVARVLNFHSNGGNIEKMKIYCHGLVNQVLDERRPGAMRGQGGFGLQFCHEGITLETVAKLAPLRGLLPEIAILACRAAHTGSGTTADGRTVEGNGIELMRRIAITTGAQVRASPNTQLATSGVDGTQRPGEWDGAVMTWSGNGEMSPRVEFHPTSEHDHQQ